MCVYCTMKKLLAIAVVVLGLLMQLRVAYACESGALGTAEPCKLHAAIADGHGDAPQDRGSGCEVALDLASRTARQTDDLDDLVAELTHPQASDPPAAWPSPLVSALRHYRPPASRRFRARMPSAASPGSSTFLVTARLRI